jgi:hypothetical protein
LISSFADVLFNLANSHSVVLSPENSSIMRMQLEPLLVIYQQRILEAIDASNFKNQVRCLWGLSRLGLFPYNLQ